MTTAALICALRPLAAIADAYDANNFDFDGARKFWGQPDTHRRMPLDRVEMYAGRGGKRLLTLDDAMKAREAIATGTGLEAAAAPLAAIADAYDANELDDDARKFWGVHLENECQTPLDEIELVLDRHETSLLTLRHAHDARAALGATRHAVAA